MKYKLEPDWLSPVVSSYSGSQSWLGAGTGEAFQSTVTWSSVVASHSQWITEWILSIPHTWQADRAVNNQILSGDIPLELWVLWHYVTPVPQWGLLVRVFLIKKTLTEHQEVWSLCSLWGVWWRYPRLSVASRVQTSFCLPIFPTFLFANCAEFYRCA